MGNFIHLNHLSYIFFVQADCSGYKCMLGFSKKSAEVIYEAPGEWGSGTEMCEEFHSKLRKYWNPQNWTDGFSQPASTVSNPLRKRMLPQLFSLEKKYNQRKLIHSLLLETGKKNLVESGQIKRRAMQFYTSLYKSDFTMGNCLRYGTPPAYGPSDNEGPKGTKHRWTLRRDRQALQDFCLLEVCNESPITSMLPLSYQRAVVSLLSKKANLQGIKNWCVSLHIILLYYNNFLKKSRIKLNWIK